MIKALPLALFFSCLPFTIKAADYPTVRELESGLGYLPGAQIPKDIPARGKGWHAYYVGSHAVGNGYYDVRIKLR